MVTLTVAIDARIRDPSVGGVQQVLAGLASGLGRLDGDDQYFFLMYRDRSDWLVPTLRGGCRPLWVRPPRSSRVPARLRRSASVERLRRRLAEARCSDWQPPASDGTVEELGADVVHFVRQSAFVTELPSIYMPHDLQHRHLPELFPGNLLQTRDLMYRTFCSRAALVAVMTEWGRTDVMEAYGLPRERTAVVPWAPSIEGVDRPTADRVRSIRHRLGPPERFLLYPAQTWPHKNHELLVEAVAECHRRGIDVSVVLTGTRTAYAERIDTAITRHGLQASVKHVGFVDDETLLALYIAATGLVFPSRFEGWGMPVVEAMSVGLPVACADSSCLPEVTGGAALLFPPDDVVRMADAMQQLWQDEQTRLRLVDRGRRVSSAFTWDRTAATYRALYRHAAGYPLSDADRALVAGAL